MLRGSLFAGCSKNLGADKNILAPYNADPTVFGLGEKIGQMRRIAPTISYTSCKVIIALEIEHNITAYGTFDYADKGKIINTNNISGTRVLTTVYYNF
jgi:hypothetical protein